ncbi:MAG: cytochrome c-type biogenesis protein CcmH [Betaproteobacteria bacterium]|nr:MAG: cytochrome c-type biogenesis protein CcmH [Betaproteobacteria bacterium]TMI05785.1 MAG: cytochrome c-type biogenesis protein CcmH [Betaproteobacteria bacterium]
MNLIASSAFAMFLAVSVASADEAALDKRVMDLAAELRCLVCQNQSLAESNAGLAVDLRNQIRAQLARGASEREVVDFMVARYGDFVLYRPPLKASTFLLWFGPFVLLIAGICVLIRRIRLQGKMNRQLSEAERLRAEQLLKE